MYAEPYDLLTIKLLVLHVSQHHEEALVKDIWNRIFQEGTLLRESSGEVCIECPDSYAGSSTY